MELELNVILEMCWKYLSAATDGRVKEEKTIQMSAMHILDHITRAEGREAFLEAKTLLHRLIMLCHTA